MEKHLCRDGLLSSHLTTSLGALDARANVQDGSVGQRLHCRCGAHTPALAVPTQMWQVYLMVAVWTMTILDGADVVYQGGPAGSRIGCCLCQQAVATALGCNLCCTLLCKTPGSWGIGRVAVEQREVASLWLS